MAGEGSGKIGRLTLYLLVLNLMVLGLGLGMEYVVANRPTGLHEFNATKIRFWSQPETYKPSAVAKPAATTVEEVSEVAPAPIPSNNLCVDIPDFGQERYQEFRKRLKASGLDDGQCVYSFEKRLAWWVFWPPEYEATQREKVVQAIRTAGIKDYLPINQGAMAQSFSLGVFTTEPQAIQHRDSLRRKGLEKVEFGPRPGIGTGRLVCQLKEPAVREGFVAGLPSWATVVADAQCVATVAESKPPQP